MTIESLIKSYVPNARSLLYFGNNQRQTFEALEAGHKVRITDREPVNTNEVMGSEYNIIGLNHLFDVIVFNPVSAISGFEALLNGLFNQLTKGGIFVLTNINNPVIKPLIPIIERNYTNFEHYQTVELYGGATVIVNDSQPKEYEPTPEQLALFNQYLYAKIIGNMWKKPAYQRMARDMFYVYSYHNVYLGVKNNYFKTCHTRCSNQGMPPILEFIEKYEKTN